MTVIAQMIADRLVLKPTRHEIPTTGKSRLTIPFRRGVLEVWTQQAGMTPRSEPEFYVLKFQGTAGRAERSTYHPLDYWTERRAELWSVNPPGYGGSSGSASLRTLSAAAETVYQELVRVANGRPIVIMGNSLGTISALYLAARHDIAGMVLRNPPPLREIILGRHGWWNLWIGAFLIAMRVPRRIDAVRNAARCTCPAIFISSRNDQIVPVAYQEKVINAYAGPYRQVNLENAGHADSMNLHQQREYAEHLEWLQREAVPPMDSVPAPHVSPLVTRPSDRQTVPHAQVPPHSQTIATSTQ